MKKLREGFEEEVSLDCKNSIELLFKSDNLEYIKWLEKRIKALTILEVKHRRKLLINFFQSVSKVKSEDKVNMRVVEKAVDEYLKINQNLKNE